MTNTFAHIVSDIRNLISSHREQRRNNEFVDVLGGQKRSYLFNCEQESLSLEIVCGLLEKEYFGHYVCLEPLTAVKLNQFGERLYCLLTNREHGIFQQLQEELDIFFVHEILLEPFDEVEEEINRLSSHSPIFISGELEYCRDSGL